MRSIIRRFHVINVLRTFSDKAVVIAEALLWIWGILFQIHPRLPFKANQAEFADNTEKDLEPSIVNEHWILHPVVEVFAPAGRHVPKIL